ncbi:MAG: hypothetical protein VX828_07015, partial [Candidatus Thermoplasmatota archaeon]|nr:hypothetical protein [Candidatus Thermoplasmatota archaeon]
DHNLRVGLGMGVGVTLDQHFPGTCLGNPPTFSSPGVWPRNLLIQLSVFKKSDLLNEFNT